jgi:hypothetical protein
MWTWFLHRTPTAIQAQASPKTTEACTESISTGPEQVQVLMSVEHAPRSNSPPIQPMFY